MDIWEFSANLIVFFLFIHLLFLFSIFNFLFIYSFPTTSWKMEVKFSIIIRVRLFTEENDLLKTFFLIIVIFLDNKYIKTLPNSNKILSENFKPISAIFQAAVVSILLYGCPTWTLTKRLKKKLDGNYTRMWRAILNKSWRQHPTRYQLCGH